MIDLSKYKITHVVKWSDNIGRWQVTYNSDILNVQTVYLVPDDHVLNYSGETNTITDSAQNILELNFWFLCLQVEQSRNKSATTEATQNTGLGAVDA